MSEQSMYADLATLFGYPQPDYYQRARRCLDALGLAPALAVSQFQEFCGGIANLTCEELQELFTRTFDLDPLCTLEIGWQLYGEDYARGALLVKMRQQLRESGVPETGELPDHLSHAFALLAKLDGEQAQEFASVYLLSAIDKMRKAWKEHRNAYACLLESTFELLRARYPYDPSRNPAPIAELRVLQ
jgi:nitrate reductase delta subunit